MPHFITAECLSVYNSFFEVEVVDIGSDRQKQESHVYLWLVPRLGIEDLAGLAENKFKDLNTFFDDAER